MALIRLSKGPRDYILKRERPGVIEKDLENAKTSLDVDDGVDIEVKKVVVNNLQAAKDAFDKFGATVWTIESLSKADLHRTLENTNYKLSFRGDELTTGAIASLSLRAYDICKKAIKGWKNLRDADGNEVPFKWEYIDSLDEGIVQEISQEASGMVVEEEAKNSDTSPSSLSGLEKTQ